MILLTKHFLLVIITFTISSILPQTETPPPTMETFPIASQPITTPFTQSDLQVLTGNVQRPNGVIWHDSTLYAACNGDWTLYELDDTSGSTSTYIYGVRNSHTLLIDSSDDGAFEIWVPDYDMGTLLRVNQQGAPEQVASDLPGPWGIAMLDDEYFLITNLIGHSLIRVGRNGVADIVVDDLRSPTGIALDEDHVYIANNGSARRSIEWAAIEQLESDEELELKPLISGLQNTTGIVLGADGKLYFAYAMGTRGVIGRVDPDLCTTDEGCTSEDVEVVLLTELAAPLAGLTLSDDMRLFVHTIFRPEIYWMQLPIE